MGPEPLYGGQAFNPGRPVVNLPGMDVHYRRLAIAVQFAHDVAGKPVREMPEITTAGNGDVPAKQSISRGRDFH